MGRKNVISNPWGRSIVPHEDFDAYWFAQMLKARIMRVAEERASQKLTRRLESALGGAVRFIALSVDGQPDKAHERLVRAREALDLAATRLGELSDAVGIPGAVIDDFRERSSLLVERLDSLKGKHAHTWKESNCLPALVMGPDWSGDYLQ